MRTYLILILIGLGLLTLALVVRSGNLARENPGRPINSTMRLALENKGFANVSTEEALLIAKKFTGSHKQPSGLIWVPRRAGSGPLPTVGQEVVVHYQGSLLLDGTVFDDSYARNEPLTLRAGVGEAIPGWDEALLQMRKGGKRTLIVPYWLAYGVKGREPHIPPRSTLVFEIELLEIR